MVRSLWSFVLSIHRLTRDASKSSSCYVSMRCMAENEWRPSCASAWPSSSSWPRGSSWASRMGPSVRPLQSSAGGPKLNRRLDTNNPADGVFVCADGDPPGDHHFLAYSWLPVLIVESILMCLSLYKGWQSRRAGFGGSTALRMLTRDSVIYFMAYVNHPSKLITCLRE